MILAWTEVTTVVLVGLCSGIGFAILGIWQKSNTVALEGEKSRLDLITAEMRQANQECEQRDDEHRAEIKALQAEIRDLWTSQASIKIHRDPEFPSPH